ncbi:copper chaperone PCu(A)C [Paenirhodobacter populi]|uniref:copper chaperone PCu(A)C n=1 Tax=Paenirhodobacter populi TaxID=2306993 RepID=UPI000FE3B2C5|nr:copper chaperone PCu(A)C [Sinirhodobacter populi]RWR04586.1 copper chaperone PCu(A)C [Sinirhodobacter populi]
MRHRAVLLCALAALAGAPLHAGPDLAGRLVVHGAWIPAPPPVARVAAGYAVLSNTGPEDLRLTAASSPRARAEFHQMRHEDDEMRMRALPEGIVVPAHGTLDLQPGAVHLMFLDLDGVFAAGERIPVVLQAEDGARLSVEFEIRQPGPLPAGDDGHSGH